MPKISALPPAGTLADDDETPFVDDSVSTTKKFTLAGLKTWLQSLVGWITTAMIGANQVTYDKVASTTFAAAETQIGVWTDARPIYRKIVSMGSGPNNTVKDVAHGITNLDIVLRIYGPSGSNHFPAVFSSTTVALIETIRTSGANLRWRSTYDATGSVGYAIVEYVKT